MHGFQVVREAHKQRELEKEDTQGEIRYPKFSVAVMQLRSLVAVVCTLLPCS